MTQMLVYLIRTNNDWKFSPEVKNLGKASNMANQNWMV